MSYRNSITTSYGNKIYSLTKQLQRQKVILANQSINQSINLFQRKTQTVQFTNICKYILFLHDIVMIIAIMKTIDPFE